MKTSLISIIIPVYNVEEYLRKCVDSVLAQTYKNLEIILVDDGSTDKSGQICDQYAQRENRVVVIHQTNAGVSAARNAGLRVAKGEYIGFVDADDYIASDMYSYLYDLIQTYQVPLAVCNYFDVRGKDIIARVPPIVDGAYSATQVLTPLIHQMGVCNKLFSKSLFDRLYFSSETSYGEDLEVVFALFLQAKKIAYGHEAKYYYFFNSQSATHSEKWNPKHLNYLSVSNNIMAYAKTHHLPQLYRSEQTAQFFHFSICFRNCVLTKPLDKKSADFLQNYFRQRFFTFLCSDVGWNKKLFVLCSFINFNLAKRIYILLQGHKK